MSRYTLLALLGIICLGGCRARQPEPPPVPPRPRGDEIVVCGKRFHVGAAVVLWNEPDGFDGYSTHRRFKNPQESLPSNPEPGCNTPLRYSPVRGGLSRALQARVAASGWTLDDLQSAVDQFVIHYDACGTSRRCFEILHDVRGLSVHFMLDADGTIYQTLDLQERARHAGSANDRSIGIEIASIGAYESIEQLDKGYESGPDGRIRLRWPPDEPDATAPLSLGRFQGDPPAPPRPSYGDEPAAVAQSGAQAAALHGELYGDERAAALDGAAPAAAEGDVPAAEGNARATPPDGAPMLLYPARQELFSGIINRRRLVQYDFTPQQYASLAKLTATLVRVFPRIRLDVPRTAGGRVRRARLTAAELARWHGLLGHYHISDTKYDPGPAFDWERLLRAASKSEVRPR